MHMYDIYIRTHTNVLSKNYYIFFQAILKSFFDDEVCVEFENK